MIRLVIADIGGLDPRLREEALLRFPAARREELSRLHGLRRSQGVAGEAIVRLAARAAGREQAGYARGEGGKPYLEGLPGFCFNLSHSGERVVCAFASLPVGADIERVAERDFRAVAERCFSAREREEIGASASPLTEFYRVWTVRESVLKRRGMGLGALRGTDAEGERVLSYVLTEGALLPYGAEKEAQYVLSVCFSEGEKEEMEASFCGGNALLGAYLGAE